MGEHHSNRAEDDNSGESVGEEKRCVIPRSLGVVHLFLIYINGVEGEGWDSLSLSMEFSRLRVSFDTKATDVSDVKVFHTQ